jgi:uncharacterized membrane protein YraQ (UPF0718 family)
MPISAGIAFLLAAPIINPIVLASTFAAYGWGTVLLARFGFGFLIAVVVGMVFSLNADPSAMMREVEIPVVAATTVTEGVTPAKRLPFLQRIRSALQIAGEEFFEMGRYLILGSILAALMQTLIPQNVLLSLGSGPLTSVIMMQILAFVLSVCSTVDAFLSLAFVTNFTTGSVLGFLIFGPMVDIKSTLMFLGVFKRKTVAYLILLPFLLSLLIGVFVNLYTGW